MVKEEPESKGVDPVDAGEVDEEVDVQEEENDAEDEDGVKLSFPNTPSNSFGRWSRSEDDALKLAVKTIGPRNWKRIASDYLENKRTDVQCLHRWQKVLRPGLVKGPWTADEDETIKDCIARGITRWSEIAQRVDGRIGKQCRERWHNHLDPSINRSEWTMEEDNQLIIGQQALGNKWSQIAKFYLPGRPENAVKNRWNAATRKRRTGESSNPTTPVGSAALIAAANRAAQSEEAEEEAEKKGVRRTGPGSKKDLEARGLEGLAGLASIASVVEPAKTPKSKRPKLTKEELEERRRSAKAARAASKAAQKAAVKIEKAAAKASLKKNKKRSLDDVASLGAAALLAAAGEIQQAEAAEKKGKGLIAGRPSRIQTQVQLTGSNLTTPNFGAPAVAGTVSPSKDASTSFTRTSVDDASAVSALQFLSSVATIAKADVEQPPAKRTRLAVA